MSNACTPILMGMASPVSEILLLPNLAKFPFQTIFVITFEDPNTEALLLVDATNAFNTLNNEVTLRNILHLCPSLGRVLINTYRDGAHLYINGESIISTERTTQGAMAMYMYALGANPLIETMSTVNEARQVWFADDYTTCHIGGMPYLHMVLAMDTIPMHLRQHYW